MLGNTKKWSLDAGLREEAEGETVRDEERGSCQPSYTSSGTPSLSNWVTVGSAL